MNPNDERVTTLASLYRHLATAEFRGYCSLYERIALAAAEDHEFLERIATIDAGPKIVPVLLNAAVHFIVLTDPSLELSSIYRGGDDDSDPWPAFRALVFERFDEVASIMATRSIQTNEVGRAAVVLPVLADLHRKARKPLALIEVGPSAGLNLFLDKFHYDYGAGRLLGDPAARVRLTCSIEGDLAPPLPDTMPPIVAREGIDLNPIDVTDDDACRWLEACLWPQVPDRAERLRAAIDLARLDPPHLRRGNAVDLLSQVLHEVDSNALPCVVSTWVLAYFSPDERAAIENILDSVGGRRDLACITAEYPSVAPWLDRPDRVPSVDDGPGATVLGLARWVEGSRDARALGWVHAHGRWIDWTDAASASASLTM